MLVAQITKAESFYEETRFAANTPALLYKFRGQPLEVILTNISGRGFRVNGENIARAGDVVWLQIGGGALVEAKVVWAQAATVGCLFVRADDPINQDIACRCMTAVDREKV